MSSGQEPVLLANPPSPCLCGCSHPFSVSRVGVVRLQRRPVEQFEDEDGEERVAEMRDGNLQQLI